MICAVYRLRWAPGPLCSCYRDIYYTLNIRIICTVVISKGVKHYSCDIMALYLAQFNRYPNVKTEIKSTYDIWLINLLKNQISHPEFPDCFYLFYKSLYKEYYNTLKCVFLNCLQAHYINCLFFIYF